MILIGQYDSSYVRRVAIALEHYNLPFEHRPWSVFGDADRIQAYNPLIRVPTLVLDNGDVLTECTTILLEIERMAHGENSLLPLNETNRRHCMSVMALAGGLADKGVSLFYEMQLHDTISDIWRDRCRSQILATVNVLEVDRSSREGNYWFGERMSHADIAVAASMLHVIASLPDILSGIVFPALSSHCDQMEALPIFRKIFQEFIPPT
ncbi:MAG: glutathione S-transferase family protein [Salaquimonas sp.]